jgi:SOS-response transcriptional repressor LexA
MQQALGLTSTSHVAYYLETLEQQGYLRCQPHISRGVTLTPAGHALAAQATDTNSVHQQRALNTRALGSGKGHRRLSHPPLERAPA